MEPDRGRRKAARPWGSIGTLGLLLTVLGAWAWADAEKTFEFQMAWALGAFGLGFTLAAIIAWGVSMGTGSLEEQLDDLIEAVDGLAVLLNDDEQGADE